MDDGRTHAHRTAFWGGGALARWRLFGPPLRPSEADGELLARVLDDWAARCGPPRLLLLGCTPEVHALAARRGWDVLAVDRASAMLDAVWPGSRARACCADWTRLPLAHGCCDVAFLDGGLQILSYPAGQAALAGELARVVRPGGLFVSRTFVPPAAPETAQDVLADLRAGTVQGPDALRLRLWMALQQSPAAGVALARVWEVMASAEPDLDALAARLGWDAERLRVLDGYRHATERYHLTNVEEMRGLFDAFALEDVLVPDYPLGECCPTVVLRRRAA